MAGAWWVAVKTSGSDQMRAKLVARGAWWGAALFTVTHAVMSFWSRPEFATAFANDPRHMIAATVAMSGLIGVRLWDRSETELLTFFASASFVVGIALGA